MYNTDDDEFSFPAIWRNLIRKNPGIAPFKNTYTKNNKKAKFYLILKINFFTLTRNGQFFF